MAAKSSKAQRADAAFAAVVLIVALVFLAQAWRLPPSRFDPLGPGSFPIAISILLAVLAGAALLLSLAGRDLGAAETSIILGVGDETEGAGRRRHGLGLFVFVATAVYAAVLGYTPVGFFAATTAFIFAAGYAMSDRSRRSVLVALAVAFGVSAALTLGFGRLLGFPLP